MPAIDFKRWFEDKYPVPFTAGTHADGQPDFKTADKGLIMWCNARNLCGVCGHNLNVKKDIAWIAGPHPKDKLTSGDTWFLDPPMHENCARYSLEYCPHLSGERIREDTPEDSIPDTGIYVGYICRGRIIAKNKLHTRPQQVIRVIWKEGNLSDDKFAGLQADARQHQRRRAGNS